MRAGGEILPVEVEVTLAPGLPQFHFLGLPDAAIRESELRVKSALRQQGFEAPRAHQTIVQLRPAHVRKTSRGLDLAVAAALLSETGQLRALDDAVIYGELTLTGEVLRPDDLEQIHAPFEGRAVLTGPGPAHSALETWVARDLRSLATPERLRADRDQARAVAARPPLPPLRWKPEAATLLSTIAAGEHSCVIAGAPGTGKTTLAESVCAFMPAPSQLDLRRARAAARERGLPEPQWRPTVQPHHTSSALALIGGGSPPRPGEITRADGGALILDELLEFDPGALEALREPMDHGSVRLARAGSVRVLPARFALVATTNLCPCGKLDLFDPDSACRCPRAKRERYLSRLSGPFLDRAHILAFTGEWRSSAGPELSSAEVLARVDRAGAMRAERGQSLPNGFAPYAEIERTLTDFERTQIVSRPLGSARRAMAIARVGRTLADLDGSRAIESEHWSRAMRWCACSFERLQSRA